MAAATSIEFFGGDTAAELTFGLSGWQLQNEGSNQWSTNYANELGVNGNEILNGKYGTMSRRSFTFVSTATTGNLSIPNVGKVSTTHWHIDRVRISWDRTQLRPKMTIEAHWDNASVVDGGARKYAASVTFAAVPFGVPTALGGIALASGTAIDVRSATYTLECSHVTEYSHSGGFLAHENYDGVETLDVEFTGRAAENDDFTVTSGWTMVNRGITPSNTGATTTSVQVVHHISHVTGTVGNSLASPAPGNGDGDEGEGGDGNR